MTDQIFRALRHDLEDVIEREKDVRRRLEMQPDAIDAPGHEELRDIRRILDRVRTVSDYLNDLGIERRGPRLP